MQDLNDKVGGNSLTSTEWNQMPTEIQNMIEDTGQTLSGSDLDQLGKAVKIYVSDSDFYLESGAANAYVLTSQTGRQPCESYTVGMRIRFIPGNSNTAASTVNVDSLGLRNLYDSDGVAFTGGGDEINAGLIYEFAYNGTEFVLISPILGAVLPIGSTILWHTSTPPSKFLECDGSSLNTTTYAKLFAVIGYTYGGSGASFNLPDFRGEFLRGWDHTAGNDPDAASRTNRGDGTTGDNIGTKQTDAYKSHNHDLTYRTGAGVATGVVVSTADATVADDSTLVKSSGGNETRPRNVNVMYCIRAS